MEFQFEVLQNDFYERTKFLWNEFLSSGLNKDLNTYTYILFITIFRIPFQTIQTTKWRCIVAFCKKLKAE